MFQSRILAKARRCPLLLLTITKLFCLALLW